MILVRMIVALGCIPTVSDQGHVLLIVEQECLQKYYAALHQRGRDVLIDSAILSLSKDESEMPLFGSLDPVSSFLRILAFLVQIMTA